ncbi:MAG: type IV pilus assembly protein PilM [Deltaproteobacteria bacterium]|nr:type IV pilus assembly protein PilM [Deltaproteobacteria bacterium]
MFFSKKNHLVGLDIGSRTLKAAEVVKAGNGFVLKKIGFMDIAPGMIEDGVIKQPEELADSLRQLFKAYNIKERNVAISIGGYSVIIKKILLEQMTEAELQERIKFEAEQYIPFDIDDVNIDFQILGENEHNPNQMNVLLVASKKEIINDYINLVQSAGLNLCIIDTDTFALQNIFETSYPAQGEPIALIDIGAVKTSINIIKNNSSVFIRDVSLGCGQINQKIIEAVGCTLEEAEQIKHDPEANKIPVEELNSITGVVIDNWCTEIRRAVDFYYSTAPEDQIAKFFFSGGGANVKRFRDLLAEQTSTEVKVFNPFDTIEVADNIDYSYLKQIAPQAVICMGLAIRRVDDK